MRGRFAPLAVWPFSRLLSSYTLNELGDSVGVVALSILVFDRTSSIPATAAFFLVAKFLPALIAPALTARLDRSALRRSLPTLYVLEAVVFGLLALIAHGTFVLPFVLVLGLVDGVLAITARGLTRGAVGAVLGPAEPAQGGQRADEHGLRASPRSAARSSPACWWAASGSRPRCSPTPRRSSSIAVMLASTRSLPQLSGGTESEHWRERLASGPALRAHAASRPPAARRPGGRARALHA